MVLLRCYIGGQVLALDDRRQTSSAGFDVAIAEEQVSANGGSALAVQLTRPANGSVGGEREKARLHRLSGNLQIAVSGEDDTWAPVNGIHIEEVADVSVADGSVVSRSLFGFVSWANQDAPVAPQII